MARRHRFWESLPVDPETDRICWPDDAESHEALAIDIVGATYVGALDHILSRALAALEGAPPEPGSADYTKGPSRKNQNDSAPGHPRRVHELSSEYPQYSSSRARTRRGAATPTRPGSFAPGPNLRVRADTLATLSAAQADAVEGLLRESCYSAGYWPLAKLRNLPDAKLEWLLVPFGPDDDERPSVCVNGRTELHLHYQQWVSDFASELSRAAARGGRPATPGLPPNVPLPPDRPGTWRDLTREERRAWLDQAKTRALRSPPAESEAGRRLEIDGGDIRDLEGLLCALGESASGPGGYLGASIKGLEDCLFGGFGVKLPLTIEVRASSSLHEALGSAALALWCREQIEARSLPWELAPDRLWTLLERAHTGRATLLGELLSMLRTHGVAVEER